MQEAYRLGALSIVISVVLAHFLLNEKLRKMGVWGCVCSIVGSVMIVIHAPREQTPNSVEEIWKLAMQPGAEKNIEREKLVLLPCGTRMSKWLFGEDGGGLAIEVC